MPPLAIGTEITYAREDTGIRLQNETESATLAPGRPLTVSEQPGRGNVSPALAARLVEDQVCTVTFVPPVAEEIKIAEEAARTEKAPEETAPEETAPEKAGNAEDPAHGTGGAL